MNNNINNFGMNPIGINPMNINPMFMNPMLMNNMEMNNIGMNNQQNLIETYENRIKSLEEIIRQKDLEIAFLKDQLSNYNNHGNNNQPIKIMNINPLNMDFDNSNEEMMKGKKIIVSYKNDWGYEKYNCFENDMTYKLFDKIDPNNRWNLIKFTCNEKKSYILFQPQKKMKLKMVLL